LNALHVRVCGRSAGGKNQSRRKEAPQQKFSDFHVTPLKRHGARLLNALLPPFHAYYGSTMRDASVFRLFSKKNLVYYSGVEYVINRLNLIAPLFYAEEEGGNIDPFGYAGTGGGCLFCFGLQAPLSFECDAERFLGPLETWGTELRAAPLPDEKKLLVLPPGSYLFAQERKILHSREIIAMSVEIQQEALWQRLQPAKKLFLRYLFEDGHDVTQVFRPVEEG
jgi:hypothetical protein